MTLAEEYELKKKRYNEYKEKKIAYDARLGEILRRAAEAERYTYDRIKNLDITTQEIIKEFIPPEEPVTSENINERRAQWRRVYTKLETYGHQLLQED